MARHLELSTVTANVMATITSPALNREALFVGNDILRSFVYSSGCFDGNASQDGWASTKRWIRGVEMT
jgi:hypothetical protein